MVGMATRIILVTLSWLLVTSCGSNSRHEVSMFDDEGDIYSLVIHNTPLGSASFEVLEFINKHLVHQKILPPQYSESSGMRIPYKDEAGITKTIGAKSITVHIGDYPTPHSFFLLKERIFISWAFDERNELISVYVNKLAIAP